jgi:hypothetical protein
MRPRHLYLVSYFIEAPWFTEPGFEQMNRSEHGGMLGNARASTDRVGKRAHHIQNEHIQREPKSRVLVLQNDRRFFEYAGHTAFELVNTIERKDWGKMPKHIPCRMTSRYGCQIESDKQSVHWPSGNMLVPMIDIRANTVNRAWLQNKLSTIHRVMLGLSCNLIVKLPMPVELRSDTASATVLSIAAINNLRN